jgi:hypothetical protein
MLQHDIPQLALTLGPLAALVIALVAAVQRHAPQVAGLWTLLLAGVSSAGLTVAAAPDGTKPAAYVLYGVVVFVLAVGGNSFATKLAGIASPKPVADVAPEVAKAQGEAPSTKSDA